MEARPEGEKLHLELQAGSKDSKKEMVQIFKIPKLAHSDTLPPTRPHLLSLPSTTNSQSL